MHFLVDYFLESKIRNLNKHPLLNCIPYGLSYHMAQSAPKERALLGIKPFWERPTLELQVRLERWRIILKLAILAREGNSIDILRGAPPNNAKFPPDPIYEEDDYNSAAKIEKDRKIRNEKLKNAWLNKCQKTEAAGTLCADRPRKFCDNKALSLPYLNLGTQGWRIFGFQEPTVQIDHISPKDLGDSLDNFFTKQGNIPFDRYTFLTRKQFKGELVENIYGCLRELSLKCDLGSHEESIIGVALLLICKTERYNENC